MSAIHERLQAELAHRAADQIVSMSLCLDALMIGLRNGVELELRFLDAEHYALNWRWGELSLRVDTAPRHPEQTTYPQHWHDENDVVRADPWTQPGRSPEDNALALIAALDRDPLLMAWRQPAAG